MRSNSSFVEMLKAHMESEAKMIEVCAELEKKVHSAAARLLLVEMRLDSVKHEGLLREILNIIEKQVAPLPDTKLWDYRIESFVDMEVVRKELHEHVSSEVDMLHGIEAVIKATSDEALKVLLGHIADDEKKHHKNVELIIHESYSFVP